MRRLLAWMMKGLHWLTGLEWMIVGVVAPLLLFPTVRPVWTATALGVLVLVWLLRWAVRQEVWPVTPFNSVLLPFALMIPVGIWASAFPELTLSKAAGLILGLAIFRAVVLTVCSRSRLILGLLLFCFLGLAILVVGILGAQWGAKVALLGPATKRIPHLITNLPELRAEAISPNQLAGVLSLYAPLSLALVIRWRFTRHTAWVSLLWMIGSLLFLVLVAGTLLLTQSRSGWIGGAAGILALLPLAGLTSSRRWVRWLGVALPVSVILGLAGLALNLGPQRLEEILYGGEAENPLEKAVGVITIAGRAEVWNRGIYAIQDFPFTGCGLGTFRRVVPILYPLFLTSPDTDIAHAHNIFLQTALDLGIPGLVAYLALLVVALAQCWHVAGKGDKFARVLALGLAAGLVALHVYGLTDALALGSKPAIVFWYALGLIAALDLQR